MPVQIATVPYTDGQSAVNLGTLILGSHASMTLQLLNDGDPGSPPSGTATIHLSASVKTTPGYFLGAVSPSVPVECDPSLLWVFVHAEGDFVQVIATTEQ